MPRTPDRSNPKLDFHARLNDDVLTRANPLMKDCLAIFRSRGQVYETLLFWARTHHIESTGDEFIRRIMRIKGVNIIRARDYTRAPRLVHVHIMLDVEAVAFLDLLTTTYPGAFANRNDAIERIIDYACALHGENPAHLLRCLQDVLQIYP